MSVRSHRTTSRTALPLVGLTALVMASGCSELFGDLGFGEWTDPSAGETRVSSASLQGELGPVSGLDHNATDVVLNEWGDETQVNVTVERADSAAMTVLTLEQPEQYLSLREGEQVTVYDSRRPSTVGNARLLGCAGPRAGVWEYDTYSDNLVVLVERRRSNRRVLTYHYVGDFSYYDNASSRSRLTTVSGSFDLALD